MFDLDRPPLPMRELRTALLAPRGVLERVEVVSESASTNTELADAVRADPRAWPAPALYVCEHQLAGKGRAGRSWVSTAQSSLTMSLWVRPRVDQAAWTWLPLMAGLGVCGALRKVAHLPAVVKWPNDVLIPIPDARDGAVTGESGAAAGDDGGLGPYLKVCGILVELVGDGAIIGVGLNVHQRDDELPVPWSTSTDTAWTVRHASSPSLGEDLRGAIPDAPPSRATMLKAVVREICALIQRWEQADGDPVAAGLADEFAAALYNLGDPAHAELAGGQTREGVVVGIDPSGALLLRDGAGLIHSIVAGDVTRAR